jgi:dipeptidyl-peptidase-4
MKIFLVATMLLLGNITTFSQKTPLTLEESVMGQFRQFAPENKQGIQFLPKSESYIYYKENSLFIGDIKGKESKWLTIEQLQGFKNCPEKIERMPAFEWLNSNEAYFFHQEVAYSVNFKNKIITKGTAMKGDGEVSDYHHRSGRLAYNIKNNLFIQNGSDSLMVTNETDGIVSGQSVSRNEYGIEKGTFWNEEGSLLAFYQKDERNVTMYPLIDYKKMPAEVKNIRYPMAGGRSETIKVGVFEVASKKTVYLEIEKELSDSYYATNVAWSPDNTVYITWLSRKTDEMKLIAFDPRTGKQRATLITETDNRWVEPSKPIIFIPNAPNQFLWYSQKDGYHRWYKYDTSGKLLATMKTEFEMTDFIGFDAKGEFGYAMGTGSNATEMHGFRIRIADMFTEQITRMPGVHRISVSGSGKFFMDQYSNIKTPNRIDIIGMGGKIATNLLNAADPLANKVVGTTEIFTVTNQANIPLFCRLIKPSNFDPNKKYPVVVYVYNGPHVQLVTNSFLGGASLWMHYLAEQGYLVFTLDGRGSQHRGKEFEQSIHRNLGTVEVDDQIAGVEWLKKQSYVDANRMGVHGWSYGGFMTTSLMLKHPDVFKAGVAGGPVIDWNLYEVMYTERYMDTPKENPDGYKNADLTQYVKNLKGKLLMIHGTDDDVVVMQHNMKFMTACIDNRVQVDFFAYPAHAHNVRGKDRVHLMQKVIDYLIANI